MDEDLKRHLERIEEGIDGSEKRLTARLDGLTVSIDGLTARIDGVETSLTAMILAAEEHIERVETALLTEFHKWASPTEQKLRTHREALRALDLQVEAIAGRVEKLEADMDRPDRPH